MKRIKLSIIMAMFNSEKTIIKALNSFVPYMSDDMELFVIDDYSSDNSLEIIKKYQKENKNKNINIIKNDKNIGAGLSRNKAIKLANGDYIGFIDSDDYVDKDYYKAMLDSAFRNNSDIVVSDISIVENDNVYYSNIYKNNIYCDKEKSNEIISKELLLGYWGCVSTCSKIFEKDLIKDCKFSELNHDDLLFTIPAIIKSKIISYCMGNQYYYYQSSSSLTRNHSFKKYRDGINALFDAIDFLNKKDINLAKIYAVNSLLPFICYSLKDEGRELDTDLLKIINENIKKYNINMNFFVSNNRYLLNTKLYCDRKYRMILKYLESCEYDKIINLLFKKEKSQSFISKFLCVSKNKLNKFLKNDVTSFNPLVSIIIPVYNGENYLKEAIDSALSQTYDNIEVIVINDGSIDNTEKIAKSFGNKIIYIKKENGGVATALNLGIEKMNGDYFSWLSHDDLYFPDKVAKQVEFLKYQKDKDVVLFSDYILINEEGYQIDKPIHINHKLVMRKKEYCLLRGSLNGITMLIPKASFIKCGLFNPKYRCTQDYDMWLRIIKEYPFIHMRDILSKTRIHSGQDTNVSPVAKSEGDELWLRMINDVPDSRKKELEGSLYKFYYKMANHLIYSPYKNTINYCINQCKALNYKKYIKNLLLDEENNPIFKKKNILEKIIYCLKTRGIKETLNIIIDKFRR